MRIHFLIVNILAIIIVICYSNALLIKIYVHRPIMKLKVMKLKLNNSCLTKQWTAFTLELLAIQTISVEEIHIGFTWVCNHVACLVDRVHEQIHRPLVVTFEIGCSFGKSRGKPTHSMNNQCVNMASLHEDSCILLEHLLPKGGKGKGGITMTLTYV